MPTKKIYAVKTGRKPGIYLSWAECENQVKGFSDAKFKSFSNMHDAQEFLTGITVFDQTIIEIYTDASGAANIGIGAWCKYCGVEYSFAKRISCPCVPTAELMAVATIVEKFDSITIGNISVIIHSDYVGPMNWISGNWKANNINRAIVCKIKGCQNFKKFAFDHVAGHSNCMGNEQADKLAGLAANGYEIDEFDLLIKKIKID